MMSRQPFGRLVHSDWSTSPKKRWSATGLRSGSGWLADAPQLVRNTRTFLSGLVALPQPTLAGFDFPIGVPKVYGERTGFKDFPEALLHFGSGAWARFYDVADAVNEISLYRPFYPRGSSSGVSRADLTRALGVESFDQLLRQCEAKTSVRRAACSLFWTLGGNQVGKAAISGWKEIIGPGREAGAKLWPFDGSLASLARFGGLTLAETYPAEAYEHIGVRFAAGQSKRRKDDRVKSMNGLNLWAGRFGVSFSPDLSFMIADGFGSTENGEDAFDAVMGLLGMIEVVDGRRSEGPVDQGGVERWEGWILGQAA